MIPQKTSFKVTPLTRNYPDCSILRFGNYAGVFEYISDLRIRDEQPSARVKVNDVLVLSELSFNSPCRDCFVRKFAPWKSRIESGRSSFLQTSMGNNKRVQR